MVIDVAPAKMHADRSGGVLGAKVPIHGTRDYPDNEVTRYEHRELQHRQGGAKPNQFRPIGIAGAAEDGSRKPTHGWASLGNVKMPVNALREFPIRASICIARSATPGSSTSRRSPAASVAPSLHSHPRRLHTARDSSTAEVVVRVHRGPGSSASSSRSTPSSHRVVHRNSRQLTGGT